MKRRTFIKTAVGLSSSLILPHKLGWAYKSLPTNDTSYLPGKQIAKEAFVTDKNFKKHLLIEICKTISEKSVNLLYIFGGGSYKRKDRLGGIWCPDSFEDLHIIRFLHQKYPAAQVQIIPVACPPVYASQLYGFEKGVFLNEPENSNTYQESVKDFIESTEKIIQNKYLPVDTYYDHRFRLLFNGREDLKPANAYGTIYEWQGSFKSVTEDQKYGTPTAWLLNSKGVVLEPPFWGNLYHSRPYTIRYTISDIDTAIQAHLK